MNNKVLKILEQILAVSCLAALLYYYVVPFVGMIITVVLGALGLI